MSGLKGRRVNLTGPPYHCNHHFSNFVLGVVYYGHQCISKIKHTVQAQYPHCWYNEYITKQLLLHKQSILTGIATSLDAALCWPSSQATVGRNYYNPIWNHLQVRSWMSSGDFSFFQAITHKVYYTCWIVKIRTTFVGVNMYCLLFSHCSGHQSFILKRFI